MDLKKIFKTLVKSGNTPVNLIMGPAHEKADRAGIQLRPTDDHPFTEICVGLGGDSYISGIHTYAPLGKNRTCIIFPGAPHSESVREGDETYSNLWICFSDHIDIHGTTYTRHPELFKIEAVADLEPLPEISSTLSKLESAYESKAHDLILTGLWSMLLGQILSSKPSGSQGVGAAHISRLVRFTVGKMNEAPDTQWSVRMLGALVGWSENHFSFRFKEVMRTSPMKYLLNIRLERAKELLLSSPLRISEIAYNSGFNSLNYFAKRFREAYKMVPREYREKFGK